MTLGQHLAFAVFGAVKIVFSALLAFFLNLLLDNECSLLKVYAIPGQPQHFALPQSGKQRNLIEIFIGVPLNSF